MLAYRGACFVGAVLYINSLRTTQYSDRVCGSQDAHVHWAGVRSKPMEAKRRHTTTALAPP